MDKNDLMPVIPEMQNLESLVQIGMSTEEEQSVRLRAIQLGIASQTCSKIAGLHKSAQMAMDLAHRCDELFHQKLIEVLPELSMEELYSYSDKLTSRVADVVKLESRLLQGRPMFADDTLSAEDRKLLRMFGNLKSEGDRRQFISALEKTLGSEDLLEGVESSSEVPTGGSCADVKVFADSTVPAAEVVDEPAASVAYDPLDVEWVDSSVGPLEDADASAGGVKLPTPPHIEGFEDDEFAGM